MQNKTPFGRLLSWGGMKPQTLAAAAGQGASNTLGVLYGELGWANSKVAGVGVVLQPLSVWAGAAVAQSFERMHGQEEHKIRNRD